MLVFQFKTCFCSGQPFLKYGDIHIYHLVKIQILFSDTQPFHNFITNILYFYWKETCLLGFSAHWTQVKLMMIWECQIGFRLCVQNALCRANRSYCDPHSRRQIHFHFTKHACYVTSLSYLRDFFRWESLVMPELFWKAQFDHFETAYSIDNFLNQFNCVFTPINACILYLPMCNILPYRSTSYILKGFLMRLRSHFSTFLHFYDFLICVFSFIYSPWSFL